MNVTFYASRMNEYASREARNNKPQTATWWVEPLIAGVLAVMVGLFCAC